MSASYWDISLNRDINGKLTTQLYDKRDYITFSIVNFPYLFSNKPLSPAYVVYISHNSFDALELFCVWSIFESRQATYKYM